MLVRLLEQQRLIFQRNNAQMRLFQAWNNWDELGALQASFELKCINSQLDSLKEQEKTDKLNYFA